MHVCIRERRVLRVIPGAVEDSGYVALCAPAARNPTGEVHEQGDEVPFCKVGDFMWVVVLRAELDDGIAEDIFARWGAAHVVGFEGGGAGADGDGGVWGKGEVHGAVFSAVG